MSEITAAMTNADLRGLTDARLDLLALRVEECRLSPAEEDEVALILRTVATMLRGWPTALSRLPADAGAVASTDCAACHGTGMFDVRHSDRLCKVCDGSGRAAPPSPPVASEAPK